MNQRTSIALISILKPVDDTRMFEKFGLSLGQTNKYDVNIIGFASKNIKKFDNIYFYPLFDFKRTSLMRLLAPWKILLLLLKVKPLVIVFNTPEILHVIILYKILTGCKIVYDMQENYFRNIYYNTNYTPPARILLAYSIRLIEWSGRWLIDRIIFAEEGYRFEMPRTAKNAVIIKNTYKELDLKGSDFGKIIWSKDDRKISDEQRLDETGKDNKGLVTGERDYLEFDGERLDINKLDFEKRDAVSSDIEDLDKNKLKHQELDPDDSDLENLNIDKTVSDGLVPENLDHTEIDYGGLNIKGSNSDNKDPDKFDLNRVYYNSRQNNDTEKFGDRELDPGRVTFLYSGTISDNYGIFTAIDFIEVIHSVDPSINLLIVGYCANEKTYRKLIDRIESRPYVRLIGGNHLVPHQKIINYIRQADFGLICYDINPSTENCFPTKIYEYLANRLPVLIQNYQPWSSFCLMHNAGIEVDYKRFDAEKLLKSIKNGDFYGTGIPEEVFWKNDEEKLLKLFKDIQS